MGNIGGLIFVLCVAGIGKLIGYFIKESLNDRKWVKNHNSGKDYLNPNHRDGTPKTSAEKTDEMALALWEKAKHAPNCTTEYFEDMHGNRHYK